MNTTRFLLRTGVFLSFALAVLWAPAQSLHAQPGTPDDQLFGISWQPAPKAPCHGEDVWLVFTACTCNTQIVSAERDSIGPIRVRAVIREDIVCVQCAPASVGVPVGQLAAGSHVFLIEIQATFVAMDSTTREETGTGEARIEVSPACPPPGGLKFTSGVRIGGPPPCEGCPPQACEGDSIPVYLFGWMPDYCHEFEGVELVPSPVAAPFPVPPVVRLNFSINSCTQQVCALALNPWSAMVRLPPLPSLGGMTQRLMVEEWLGDECLDWIPPHQIGFGSFPFTVGPCSTSVARCFEQGWQGPSGGDFPACHATVSETEPAHVVLTLDSRVALAGIQGDLVMDSTSLRITGLRPVGPAQDMHLDWKPTAAGARFVLFAESGAPIPGGDPGNPVPVLEVEASAQPGAGIPALTRLYARNLLGSDVEGMGVYPCPRIYLDLRVDPGARICRAALCDLNGDGAADVRDLVLLVHCVLGEGPCPPPGNEGSADCDGNGDLELGDVFCCAQVVLHGEMPDTAAGRPEPLVGVALGAPAQQSGGLIEIPLTLRGADRVGAARLEVAFPGQRYEVVAVDFPGLGAEWMSLHEPGSGRATLGLIGLSSGAVPTQTEIPMTLRLRLRPGQAHGGEVALAEAEFAGRDGVALEVDTGQPSLPLGGFTGIALSPASPNPFRDEVRFAVLLSAPGDLEVTVYDATGRQVAVLHRGAAPAGAFEVRWQGRRDDGSLAGSGVYLLRAAGLGTVATRKVQFLGAR
jgi:hypothetical protein